MRHNLASSQMIGFNSVTVSIHIALLLVVECQLGTNTDIALLWRVRILLLNLYLDLGDRRVPIHGSVLSLLYHLLLE